MIHFTIQTCVRILSSSINLLHFDQHRRWLFDRRWANVRKIFEKIRSKFSIWWKTRYPSNPVSWKKKNKNSFIWYIDQWREGRVGFVDKRNREGERGGGWKKNEENSKRVRNDQEDVHSREQRNFEVGGKKLHSYKIIYEVGQWGREKIVLQRISCCWIKLSGCKEDISGWFMAVVGQWERIKGFLKG